MLNRTVVSMLLLISLMLLSACGAKTERMSAAEESAPAPKTGEKEQFRERNQIITADYLSNRDDVLFWAYHLADDGRNIDQWVCQGRPVSSTESIEPNEASPTGWNGGLWLIKVDGRESNTTEVMGIDTTYGDAVPYLFCITPEGHYEQWSIYSNVRISTFPRTYPEPMVRVDEAQFAKMEEAKRIMGGGGCIDSNLNEIPCSDVSNNLQMETSEQETTINEEGQGQ